MLALARILPKTPVYQALVSSSASGVVSITEQEREQAAHLGRTGLAVSNLRPSGKARFGDEVLDVITQGDMIGKGQPVKIIGYSGSAAVVAAS
jgi:membrane-bound serine protease (ClpP class)